MNNYLHNKSKIFILTILSVVLSGIILRGYAFEKSLEVREKNLNTEKSIRDEISKNPKNVNMYVKLIKFYTDKGELYKANEASNRAILAIRDASEIYSATASMFYKAGQIDKAMLVAEKSAELDKYNSEAYFIKGKIFFDRAFSTNDKTIKNAFLVQSLWNFKQALEYNSNLPEAHAGLGKIYLERNDTQQALSHLSAARDLDKTNPAVYINLGDFYSGLKSYEKAIKYYRKSFQYEKKPLSETYYKTAELYEKLSDLENAKMYYIKALQFDPYYQEAETRLNSL
jgi:Flp pilus assembly protein TadD